MVGAGGMGKNWARNLNRHPGVEFAAWIDVRSGAAESAARELDVRAEYYGTDLGEMLAHVGADFVVDVTPPEVHHDVTLEALGHGLPVLGEKPMAASMSAAKEMVAASEASGKLYMVSQSRRYNSQIRSLRHLVESQTGPLGILNADFYIGAHFGGFRDEMAHVLLVDMAIHTFDEARYISGKDAVSVYAEEFNPAWSWYRGDACADAIFQMEGGLRFAYRGGWCAEGHATSWEGDWRAVGPHGTAMWLADEQPEAAVVSNRGGFISETERVAGREIEVAPGIEGSLNDFLDALEHGTTPHGECHDNIKSLAMVFEAVESARRGERVMLGEILG